MNIIVCIKSVIMHAPAKWDSSGQMPRTPEAVDFNPFDRPALEIALRLKEDCGGNVTALSMGPQCATFSLYEAMAMGVHSNDLPSSPTAWSFP